MKAPIVHKYLYGLFKREVDGGNIIHISQITPIIKWVVRLPRKYQKETLSDLISLGLMKKKDRDNYELLAVKCKAPYDSLGSPLW